MLSSLNLESLFSEALSRNFPFGFENATIVHPSDPFATL